MRTGLSALYPRLWRFCLVQTANKPDADDLAQAACIKAIEKSAQFQKGTHLDRWVFRIARTIWLNQIRANAVRHGAGTVSVDDSDIASNAPSAEMNIFTSQVLSRIMTLPASQRLAVLLVYGEGNTYQEAADMLDIPIGTVMSRLAAARKTLNKMLNEGNRDTG